MGSHGRQGCCSCLHHSCSCHILLLLLPRCCTAAPLRCSPAAQSLTRRTRHTPPCRALALQAGTSTGKKAGGGGLLGKVAKALGSKGSGTPSAEALLAGAGANETIHVFTVASGHM